MEKLETSSATRASYTNPICKASGSNSFITADYTAVTAGSEVCTEDEQQYINLLL